MKSCFCFYLSGRKSVQTNRNIFRPPVCVGPSVATDCCYNVGHSPHQAPAPTGGLEPEPRRNGHRYLDMMVS